jgi:preprotein translocase subunit YajC
MLLTVLTLLADAEANNAAPPAQGPWMGWEQLLLFFVVPLLILWFFVLRPQQKLAREQREQVSNLKKNDEVITSGGIIGTVVSIKEKPGGIAGEEDVVTIRLDGNTRMQVLRSSIARVLKADEAKKESDKKESEGTASK